MKRKIVSILLCLAVCMAMMPTMGYATPEYYSWKVAGIDVTSDNANNITGDGISGTVTYDATSNTLTLKDATIDGIGIKYANGNNKPPTIVIEGDNKIEASSDGIAPYSSAVSNLTIKSEDGKGKLTVTGSAGIDCSMSKSTALTLSHVEVEATGTKAYGIYAKGDISLNHATVTATAAAATNQDQTHCGIRSEGKLTLTKSSISAKKGNGSSYAIRTENGIFAGSDAELENAPDGVTFIEGQQILSASSEEKYVTLRNNFEEYPLWVGGVQVTDKNKENVLEDDNKTVSYDAATNTLTLNSATITGSLTNEGISAAVMAVRDANGNYPDINIKLVGTNRITNSIASTEENAKNYGIYSPKNISVTKDNTSDSDATITIESNDDAIHAGKETTISNVTVTASSTTGDGIYSLDAMTITNANVTAEGVNGIQSGHTITAEANAKVEATGTTGDGISSVNTITITNAKVTAKGVNGIQSGDEITTGNDATVQAEGKGTTGHGIVANNDIGLFHSYIEVKCESGDVIVSKNGRITCTAEIALMKNGTNVYRETSDGRPIVISIKAKDAKECVILEKNTDRLYYNTADGKVYTSYDKDTNTFSDPWDRGGITGKHNTLTDKYDTLTLTNLYFVTMADEALVIPGMEKSDTITINCEGENIICAGYGGNEEDYGIKTNANLIINGGTLSMETSDVHTNIYAGGDIQLVDTDVTVRRFITDGKLTLENAILYITNESTETGEYNIETVAGIYYYNDLYASGTIDCEWFPDSDNISKLGKNSLTLFSEAFAYFDANGGKWEDGKDHAIIRSEEKQANGERWITIPAAPTREGYTFIGWFTEEEGGAKIIENKVKYNGSTDKPTALVQGHDFSGYNKERADIYYAHWTKLCENHTFGDWTITKPPTATEKGSKERVCSVCQYKGTAEIPATGGSTSGGGSTVTPVQKPEIQPVSGGKTGLSKDGSTLEITPDEGMEIGTVTVNGKEVTVKDGKITGLKTGDKVQVTFKAKAPTKEAMDQKVAETVKGLSLTVRTSRTENRNVRATVQADSELNAAVQEFKAAGYTVKYKFYRSTKKASGFKRMLTKDTNAYVNTMGDQGTYYYYKARLAVYDAEGKLVAQTALKQCKAGNRLWIK